MTQKEFDVNYWEDVWAAVPIPYQVTSKHVHELHRLFKSILPASNLSLIEVGCAPGGWLAYFHDSFHYSVSGIEYAPQAYKKTVENLRCLNVPGQLFLEDFFTYRHELYDCVFSSGFIEHFVDARRAIRRLVDLCKPGGGLVITIIPNLEGINRWISRTFRPRVAAGHFPITKMDLLRYHEDCGLETLYCNYVGSLHVVAPMDMNRFSKENPALTSMINLPFRAWNRLVSEITRRTCLYPKLSFVSSSVVYIGRK